MQKYLQNSKSQEHNVTPTISVLYKVNIFLGCVNLCSRNEHSKANSLLEYKMQQSRRLEVSLTFTVGKRAAFISVSFIVRANGKWYNGTNAKMN